MWSAVKCSIFSLSVLTLLRTCCKSRSEENAALSGLSGHSVSGSSSWKGCGNNQHFVMISQVQKIWARASCILSLGKTFCPCIKMKTIAESIAMFVLSVSISGALFSGSFLLWEELSSWDLSSPPSSVRNTCLLCHVLFFIYSPVLVRTILEQSGLRLNI